MSSHTYVSLRVQFIFAPAHRDHAIPEAVQPRLWAYLAGIARNLGATVYAVGGIHDHAHVFIGMPAAISVAEMAQKLKANSSRWMHEQGQADFRWQEGYAAFSVSVASTDDVIAYVQNQAEHHKRRGYGEELAVMLRKHHIKMVS